MRDLLFKNLTSQDKRRKVISSSEVFDNQGVHSVIRRHFVCMMKEVKAGEAEKPAPYLYVLKEQNNKEQRQRFYCKIKGSVFAAHQGRLYLVLFIHTLSIALTQVAQDEAKK